MVVLVTSDPYQSAGSAKCEHYAIPDAFSILLNDSFAPSATGRPAGRRSYDKDWTAAADSFHQTALQ